MRAPYLALALAAALALTACGSEDEAGSAAPAPVASPSETEDPPETAEPTTAPSPSPTLAPSPSAEASPAAAATAGGVALTPQGTRLALGKSAVVPQRGTGGTGAVSVRVDRIVRGTPADLARLELGDQVSGLTPFYVMIAVTNVSGDDLAFGTLGYGNALLRDGSQAQELAVIGGDLPQCASEIAPRDFTTNGASYRTCFTALASGTAQVTGYKHQGLTAPTIPGADYQKEPIVWGPAPAA